MGVGRPYLLAIESPARRGAFGAGANARQVRSRSRLAHSDAKIYLAAADARQIAAALVLAAEIQDQRGALPVGDPVRRDRGAQRQQFFDDHEARKGTAPAAAIVARQGRSEEHTSELQSPMRPSYAVFCL